MAQLVRGIADRKGDDVAIIDESGSTTWEQFNGRVNQLIHLLRDRGLAAGDTIAVMSGNRREFFEVVVAAVHASMVVVPVNWHWVSEELAYVLGDSDARALFVEDQYARVASVAVADERARGCAERFVIGGARFEGFDGYDESLSGYGVEEPAEQSSGGPMFYTSGTTGFPKGVRSSINDTGNDLELLKIPATLICSALGIPEGGVTLLDGPAYHSAQLALSLYPLLALGSQCVMRQQFDAASFLDIVDRHAVTNVHLVPTQFARLLKLPDDVRRRFDGSSLTTVVHGAAPCPVAIKRSMIDWWGPVLTEYYGGTESGFLTIITGAEWLSHPGSVGRARPWCEVMVINDEQQPCGVGETGQIYFRSRAGGDFRYNKSEDKTKAAHLSPGVGTIGDVGHLDAEGYLFLSDRKIDMIVSGGVNIYPAEVEGVLVTHPGVADAAVFGVPDDEMGEQVKAAIELVPGVAASPELAREIIAFCREHLAGYKCPRTIDFEDHLPRSPTGKLFKRLLREPYWAGVGRNI